MVKKIESLETITYGKMLKKWKTSDERNQIVDKVLELLTSIGMEELHEFLDEGGYFEAPASTAFHGSKIGGLAEHCLEVYSLFNNLVKFKNLDVPDETIIKCSLLHDFCKLKLYEPKIFKSGPRKGKLGYETNDQFPAGHGAKSVILLQQIGVSLNPKEVLMIQWHMMLDNREFQRYRDKIKKLCPEAILFGCCDHISSVIEEMKVDADV
jgi:hypothetical protein